MTKILIVGIGGVGGYFGGLLAGAFQGSNEVSINFMARGANLQAIQEKGLLITTPESKFYVRPDHVSEDPTSFVKMDYIVLCTKSYDIENTVSELAGCVKDETVFLPLLNGVDSAGKIKAMYKNNLVSDGCAYIISRLLAPGHVHDYGHNPSIIFGVPDGEDLRLNKLYTILKGAGINATLSEHISTKIWEKFIFISSTATVTSFYDKTFGEIKDCEKCRGELRQLIDECCMLADIKNIPLPSDIREKVWKKFLSLQPETTTSMHSNYKAGKHKTEVRSLTGYIVEQGQIYDLSVPKYQEMYHSLLSKKLKSEL